ncbi:molybdenum cofactor cytidylyltransferase [Metabacillus crassostreae]|uniref:nucleotidyltransferase family protein n=1 Tax=Metabacillus crassostreae TaxID=929098 RepID=UPI00195CD388|nr:nucleotidyltransferase family protein [Metabacillus crassostreae]MBM7603654.1 molybdenum cofactor cytidylyltransferase [Metabacillus crassostreae]
MKKIIGIYLAAGNSNRMGTCKLSLPLGGKPLGSFALAEILASKIDYLLIITKEKGEILWFESSGALQLFPDKWEIVLSEDSNKGQSYSLRVGITMAEQLKAHAVIVLLADQPFIKKETINELIMTFNNEIEYVASSEDGVMKPPILFRDTVLERLLEIEGDMGARSLLKTNALSGKIIDVDKKQLYDIDTIENYDYAKKTLLAKR